jgi:hypothetical protein
MVCGLKRGLSDLGNRSGVFALADRASLGRHAVAGTGRSEGEARIQRDDFRALMSPQAMAGLAAKPLRISRPFTIARCHGS